VSGDTIREVIAHFGDEASFRKAVEGLREAGFEREDLSVLGSHDSIEVADAAKSPLASWLDSLVGEVKYVGPLATAGLIALASGPTGFLIAGAAAAGIVGMATKEFLDDLTAAEHTEAFAHAFESGGVILWVRVDDDEAKRRSAERIAARHGGDRIHLHERRATADRTTPTA